MAKSLGALADELYALREQKGELSAQLRLLTQEETKIEEEMLAAMAKQDITQVRGRVSTISVSKSKVPHVVDWAALHKYIQRHGALQLLQRRVSVEAYRELLNDGMTPPGIQEFEKVTLNVRKI